MLCLSRKAGDSILIGEDIVVKIIEIRGSLVQVGIEAPKNVSINRSELYEAIKNSHYVTKPSPVVSGKLGPCEEGGK